MHTGTLKLSFVVRNLAGPRSTTVLADPPVFHRNQGHKHLKNVSESHTLVTVSSRWYSTVVLTTVMDHSPINQNFELNKSNHSLKEQHKISNIPKFRCKML